MEYLFSTLLQPKLNCLAHLSPRGRVIYLDSAIRQRVALYDFLLVIWFYGTLLSLLLIFILELTSGLIITWFLIFVLIGCGLWMWMAGEIMYLERLKTKTEK